MNLAEEDPMADASPCEHCLPGRVMFNGEELACVQCGWRPPNEERLVARRERTSPLAA